MWLTPVIDWWPYVGGSGWPSKTAFFDPAITWSTKYQGWFRYFLFEDAVAV